MKTTFALAALATSAAAQYRGFNYGSTATDGSAETQDTFSSLFNNAKNLRTTEAFSSARLYTMIQAGTTNGVVQALPAAANTGTSLLLGMWASAGQDAFDNELAALRSAISAYPDLVNQIAGLSVGSEDLYRITPTGIANKAGVGAAPTVLTSYISQVRSALAGTSWSGVKVGHVDTWTAYVNGSNSAVIDACDFIGVDAYPYFETSLSNSIANGETLFDQAYDATVGVAGGKPVWITETGWPLSGPQSGDAIASVANAKTYWDAVACKYLGKTNVWWYTLFDGTSSPSFGLVGSTLSTTPEFSLSCPGGLSGASSSATSSATIASSATIIGTATSAVSVAAYSSATEEPASSAAPIYGSAAASAYGSAAPSSNAPAQSVPAVTPQIVSQITDGQVQAPTAAPGTVTAVASTTPTSSACPANLSGSYQFPHLIVPVDSSKPDEAEGTQYNGQVSSTVSTAFNFDIPESYEGQTCSLIFLFPEKADLETSDYSLSGSGGLDVKLLSSPATESTSFNTLPSIAKDVGGVSDLQSGNSYVITSGPCAAGEKISYEVSATGSLALNFFEDYNPSPLGLYIASC